VSESSAAATGVALTRDCPATTVPQGDQIQLSAGGIVTVVQRLGGSITVRTEMGTLLRIDADDADALGIDTAERRVTIASNAPFKIDQVFDALGTVYDPEIPVSIVDLGLVYRCEEAKTESGGRKIEIDMTMTSPGCGMGDILCGDATRAVERMPAVDEVEVNLVFDPPWGLDRISEEARLELGLF
jgi:probable FeS assembly SUF system protein SufT